MCAYEAAKMPAFITPEPMRMEAFGPSAFCSFAPTGIASICDAISSGITSSASGCRPGCGAPSKNFMPGGM